MARMLLLLALVAAPLAAQAPTPRACFEQFVAAVLNEAGAAEADRTRALQRCFDFEAWAAEREIDENRKFPAEERTRLKADWDTLLASAEFRDNWKKRKVTIIDAPAPAQSEATLQIKLSAEGQRGETFQVKLRLNPAGDFWRWYAIVPLDRKAGDNPAPAPRTTAQQLADIEAKLAEVDSAARQLELAKEELLRQQRELRAKLEEERGADKELGSPRALAEVAGRCLLSNDWGGFLLAHAPAHRSDAAKQRFGQLRIKLAGWTVKQVVVEQEGKRALLGVELRFIGGEMRQIVLEAVRVDGRWWIDEAP
ncbi:MAG: hypothetical protein IPP14_12070 [Planctomycetes bacterium]|nr:hypothetical protein [Planctomycetota bacterium]